MLFKWVIFSFKFSQPFHLQIMPIFISITEVNKCFSDSFIQKATTPSDILRHCQNCIKIVCYYRWSQKWNSHTLRWWYVAEQNLETAFVGAQYTVMCLSIGIPKIINFPFVPNGKLIIFRSPKIWVHYSFIILCSNSGTPKNHHFSFGTFGKVVMLGVPILKHFRVISLYNMPRHPCFFFFVFFYKFHMTSRFLTCLLSLTQLYWL